MKQFRAKLFAHSDKLAQNIVELNKILKDNVLFIITIFQLFQTVSKPVLKKKTAECVIRIRMRILNDMESRLVIKLLNVVIL